MDTPLSSQHVKVNYENGQLRVKAELKFANHRGKVLAFDILDSNVVDVEYLMYSLCLV